MIFALKDMHTDVILKPGYVRVSNNVNEFREFVRDKRNLKEAQEYYQVVIDGDLRDRVFEEALRELNNWLNRLAKRVGVRDILIKLEGYSELESKRKILIISDPEPYRRMEEWHSWASGHDESAWAEYLMWKHAENSNYPELLINKYNKAHWKKVKGFKPKYDKNYNYFNSKLLF